MNYLQNPKMRVNFVLWSNLNEYFFLFADGSRIQPTSILRGSRGPLRPFGQSGPVGLCSNSLRLDRCMPLSSVTPAPPVCSLPVCSPVSVVVPFAQVASVTCREGTQYSSGSVWTGVRCLCKHASASPPPLTSSLSQCDLWPPDAALAMLCLVNLFHSTLPVH